MALKKIIRWHGEKDPIPLLYYKQIPGIEGVVTSLYNLPLGQIWPLEKLKMLKIQVEKIGLTLEVVDSFRIHEDIKLGKPTRDALIENYKVNIRNLAKLGIKLICYNFMPLFDWTRTEMEHQLPDGSNTLALKMSIVKKIVPEKGINLPGWGTNYPPEKLKEFLKEYENITEEILWENCSYFLKKILPVAEEVGIKMAIHPDDPPYSVFGLPRIMKNANDIRRLVNLSNSPANGLTICTGSLASGPGNDIPAIIREFKDKIYFCHFRNVKLEKNGDFYESGHFSDTGNNDMFEIMKALHDIKFDGYIRPDHGRMIWGEKAIPGYGLYDRALGVAYINGLWEAIDKIEKGKKL